MLLSLVGVASVVSNQWHCQLSDNRHKLDTYLTGEFNFLLSIIFFLFLFLFFLTLVKWTVVRLPSANESSKSSLCYYLSNMGTATARLALSGGNDDDDDR